MTTLRYRISIETNNDSLSLSSFATKKEAIKMASYYRTGGIAYRKSFTELENPNISVYDGKKETEIYCKPFFKYALK